LFVETNITVFPKKNSKYVAVAQTNNTVFFYVTVINFITVFLKKRFPPIKKRVKKISFELIIVIQVK
jgi:hypothetical protein